MARPYRSACASPAFPRGERLLAARCCGGQNRPGLAAPPPPCAATNASFRCQAPRKVQPGTSRAGPVRELEGSPVGAVSRAWRLPADWQAEAPRPESCRRAVGLSAAVRLRLLPGHPPRARFAARLRNRSGEAAGMGLGVGQPPGRTSVATRKAAASAAAGAYPSQGLPAGRLPLGQSRRREPGRPRRSRSSRHCPAHAGAARCVQTRRGRVRAPGGVPEG